MTEFLRDLAFLFAASCMILGLRRLSSPRTAVSGNRLAAFGMLVAVVVACLDRGVLDYTWIVAGLVLGAGIGAVAARTVQMTAMPQMVGIFNGLGGGASALVATADFLERGAAVDSAGRLVLALGALVGGLTFTGSLVAFGKLQGFVPGKPVTWPAQRAGNLLLMAVAVLGIAGFAAGTESLLYHAVLALSLLLGVLFVLPIGGGDMPVVISLLNSFSGIAASMAGFVLANKLLIVAGALVGASGLILTALMCDAMNRSLWNVIFGAFGGGAAAVAGEEGEKTVRKGGPEDAAILLTAAELVVIVPGYGLAVARAQHTLRDLAEALEQSGVEVRYAIHPVAGRMPGHMNVLLAEADVPYDRLYELDQANPDMERTDVALVVGANDVVNPSARSDSGSPIYGMPIVDVDKAKNTIVLKRSLSPGFAGIDNPLFYMPRTMMVFGDAADTLMNVLRSVKEG